MMQRAGEIDNLQRQVKFVLIPAQREISRERYSKGPNRGKPKPGPIIERECAYYADFFYFDVNTRENVVEDVKGYRGGGAYEVFKIKRKLMLQKYGLRVKEV